MNKKAVLLITALFLVSSLLCGLNAPQARKQEQKFEYNFSVLYLQQFYEIDPGRKVFSSSQVITIKNSSEKSLKDLLFVIHPDLIIDSLHVSSDSGADMKCSVPVQVGTETFFKKYIFPVMKITSDSPFLAEKKYLFHLKYHLKPSAVLAQPEGMYELTISPRSSYAIGPLTGNNPFFGRNVTSPFEMTLKYPKGNHSCAPGRLTAKKVKDGFVFDTYKSIKPNIPTFSCAPYRKIIRQRQNMTVEYYLYPHEKFSSPMVDNLFQAVNLYFEHFGDNHTDTYRFATVGVFNYHRPGGENKGNAIFFPDSITRLHNSSETGKIDYAEFLYHEVFHNWNLFFLRWQGPLQEWFVEGGANFTCSWAVEKTLGPKAAIYIRNKYIKRLINDRGISSPASLWNISKSGSPERALIYTYGALVWEQLRKKLGDSAFFAGLKDFFIRCAKDNTSFKELCASFGKYSQVQVAEFLNPWVTANPSIKITIADVKIIEKDSGFISEVSVNCDSGKNYEIASSIGFRTAPGGELTTIPLHFNKSGKHVFRIKSQKKPVYIEIDPECLVPRVNIENRIWQNNS